MFFSDHGTPVGWRNNHGYGCHTFKWCVYRGLFRMPMILTLYRVNAKGEFVYIKYHFLADGGQKQFTADEALRHGGEDPDYSKRDLWQAIEKGEQLTWTAHAQVMEPEQADPGKLGFDPFDVTKVWPKDLFPVRTLSKPRMAART